MQNKIFNFSLTVFAYLVASLSLSAQIIETDPVNPGTNEPVNITLHTNLCNCTLNGYTGDIYVHTGLLTNGSVNDGDWKHVKTAWGENTDATKLEKIDDATYIFHITPDIETYYGIQPEEIITQLAFVFRSADATKQTSPNLYYDVVDLGLNIELTLPASNQIVQLNDTITIQAESFALNTNDADSIVLYLDDTLKYTSYTNTLNTQLVVETGGTHWIKVVARNNEFSTADSVFYFVREELPIAELPPGVQDGINYIDSTTVTLVLFAPNKENVFVMGDFNNWELNNEYLMNRTSDSERYWITLSGLTKGVEYAFQYLVDGSLRIADPYADKILDPWNDPYIPSSTYADLKEYPNGKTTGIVSVFQPAQEEYLWMPIEFIPPKTTDLVIYEAHVRDFTEAGNFKTLLDTLDYLERLGINALELMPINEFEGNDSWGYNPSFYFAVDKAYGTKNDFKQLVEACHQKGIAVILDMVLNHSYDQSPLVQLYFDASTGKPTAENPWYNVDCPAGAYCWGNDFNHESTATQEFITRVNRYWIDEYNIDGYRFDFTKGFTNTPGEGTAYDAARIAIVENMYDSIIKVKSNALVICEHWGSNAEETELANYGLMLWGNSNSNYNEATMGYNESGKSNFSNISYENRGWNDPHLVGYMESHDEERLMYKNITYGNQTANYDARNETTALSRIEAAASMFLTVPGPKMIWQFGELGYDISIDVPSRVGRKPILWEYYDEVPRQRLYQVFSALNKLRVEEDLFETDDFDLSVASALKKIHLNSTAMNATLVANFDVVSGTIAPAFQHTGTWYDYFSGNAMEVIDVNALLTLTAGEYHIYTDEPLETPNIIVSLPIVDSKKQLGVIYPNPSDGVVYLLPSVSGQLQFELYNLSGQKILQTERTVSEGSTLEIPLNEDGAAISKGYYIYRIRQNSVVSQGKLIVQ